MNAPDIAQRGARPAPDELPLLRVGKHARPQEGACVMEYVSVLAGEAFADRPRCVHPALAGLARQVNDRITDHGLRARLALLAPDMIEIDSRDRRVGAQVEVTCLLSVAVSGPLPRWAARRLTAASRRTAGPHARVGRVRAAWQRGWEAQCPSGGVVPRMLDLLADRSGRPGPERDRRLYELLGEVVADCRALGDLSVQPAACSRRA